MTQTTFSVDGSFQTHPYEFNFWTYAVCVAAFLGFSITVLYYSILNCFHPFIISLVFILLNALFIYLLRRNYMTLSDTYTIDANGVEVAKRGQPLTKILWKDVESYGYRNTTVFTGAMWVPVVYLSYKMKDGTMVDTSVARYARKTSINNALKFYFEQSRK